VDQLATELPRWTAVPFVALLLALTFVELFAARW
jgi:hypothetical protein